MRFFQILFVFSTFFPFRTGPPTAEGSFFFLLLSKRIVLWSGRRVGGNLAAEKRRFRESEHLSLAQARDIIRKNYGNDNKQRETKETFFNLREGKNSALMKKRVAKRLETKEARSNGTVATTRGSGVHRIMSSDTVLAIGKELERDVLNASNVKKRVSLWTGRPRGYQPHWSLWNQRNSEH